MAMEPVLPHGDVNEGHLAFCLTWAYGYTGGSRLKRLGQARLANNLELLRQMTE